MRFRMYVPSSRVLSLVRGLQRIKTQHILKHLKKVNNSGGVDGAQRTVFYHQLLLRLCASVTHVSNVPRFAVPCHRVRGDENSAGRVTSNRDKTYTFCTLKFFGSIHDMLFLQVSMGLINIHNKVCVIMVKVRNVGQTWILLF